MKKVFVFKNVLVFFVLIFFVFISINIINTNAQDISQMQNEIKLRNEKIEKLQAEINAYSGKVAKTQEEAKTLKEAINKLEAQKKDLQNQISLTNLKIKTAEENILITSDKIYQNEDNIYKNKKNIAEILYKMKENDDNNIFILNFIKNGKGNLTEFLNNTYQFININNILKIKVDELSHTIDELNTNKNEYEKQRYNLDSLSRDLNNRENIVLQNQKEQNSILSQTKNQEKEYQKLISDRQKIVKSLEEEINSFEAKIKYTLNKNNLPADGKGLIWPVENPKITQYFGNTEFAQSGAYNGSGHNGIDLGIAVGREVFAAQSGTIMGTGNTDIACNKASYGKWILIKHENGLATLYGHLSSIDVSVGEKVKAGDHIALSGNTGYSTGPHLHFTVIASDAVRIFGPTEYKSKTCGTYMVMPYAALNAYLNPLTYLPKL